MRIDCAQLRSCTLLCVLVLSSCKGTSPLTANPSIAVKSFYMSCNAREYSKAEDQIASDIKKQLHGQSGALSDGVKLACDNLSRKGTITTIDVVGEEIRGNVADVNSMIHYKDGTSINDHEPLVKENGSWMITSGQ